MKFYKCVTPWKRHSVGEIIPDYEYNKLPHEIKQHGNFILLPDVVINTIGFDDPVDGDESNSDFPVTVDALKSLDQPKPHRYADKGNRSQRNSGNPEFD